MRRAVLDVVWPACVLGLLRRDTTKPLAANDGARASSRPCMLSVLSGRG